MNATLTLAPALLLAGLAASAWTTVENPAPAAPQALASYQVDPGHSFVLFRVNHLGIGTAYGQFRTIAGDVVYDAENPANSSISLTIDAASIDTNSEGRDKHLRGADFFSVKEFPEITFKSSKIAAGKEKGSYLITGMLNMHGVEKEVTAQGKLVGAGKDPWGKTRVGLEAELKVNRMDFGVDYMPDGLGKEVSIVVAVEAILNEG
jgi:polyisoprenoid-binding protein YceI